MMTAPFDNALARILRIEGGFSNHANDRGGPTHWGITERIARANGYRDRMEDMPLGVAREIYRRQYWDGCNLESIAALSPELADRLFDIAVNMGQAVAGKLLQRCLNVLNRGARDYADITVDGIIGRVTIAALSAYIRRRAATGSAVLVAMLIALQGARYVEIAEDNRSQEDFVFGWIRQRILGEM